MLNGNPFIKFRQKSRFAIRDRFVEFVLAKKDVGAFWPRLLADSEKASWLKTDFDKWRDEDEFDGTNTNDFNLDEVRHRTLY